MVRGISPEAKTLQEKRVKKLIELIKKYNKGFKTTTFPKLVVEAGFPATTGFNRPVTFYNRYPDAPRLNSRQTQVNKAVDFLLDEKKLNQPAIKFKNFKEQIAKLTGLPTGGRSITQSSNLTYYLQKSPRYKEFEKPLNYINVPASRLKTIQRGKNFTFADVIDMYSTKAPETISRGFTAYEQPSSKIFDFAKRHVNLGGKKIKFLNENEFLYKGKKYDRDFLSVYGRKDKNFKEFFKAFDQRRNLFSSEVKHPVTGEKVKFKDVLEESYGTKNPLDIDHIKGIKNEPFTNLRVIPTRINQAAGNIKQKAAEAQAGLLTKTADDYTPDKVDQMLKKIGYGFTKGTKKLKEDELKLAEKILKEGRELRTPITIAKEVVDNFAQKVKSVPGGCRAVVAAALGGPIDKCEAIIKADPEKAAVKLNNAITATKGPLKDLKEDSQKLIRLYRGEGFNLRTGPSIKEMAKTFDVPEAEAKKKLLSGQWFTSDPVAAASYTNKLGKTKYVDVTPKEFTDFKRYVERVNKTKSLSGSERYPVGTQDKLSIVPRYKLKEFEEAGKLKTQRNIFKNFNLKSGYVDRPEGVLSYDSVKGGFVDPADPTTIVNQDQIKAWAEANPEKVTAGTEAVEAATNKSVLSNVAKSLARVGAPLPIAAIDSYFIGKQVADGKGTAEIASNPLNWLGLATMEPLAKASGIAEPGKLNAILRLGLNPATIRGITRFAGLPGLAVSTAMTAYDQYQKYKDGEGFIFNLLNQKGTE